MPRLIESTFKLLLAALALALGTHRAGADSVTSFTLIDADSDSPVAGFDPLADGATVNLDSLPTGNLNVRANTDPATVGSVRFALDGNANFRTENGAPYALAGDSGGNYAAWMPALGAHTLTATPFSSSGGNGTAGTPSSISFTVIDEPPVPAESVADTKFSHDRGFYSAAFDLAITTATAGATIVYTLDGSEPSEASGQAYSAPIPITTTATVRAFAFKSGLEPTNLDTHTYLFIGDVINQPATIPGYPNNTYWLGGSQSNTAVHDHAMDPQVVDNPAYSATMADAMTAVPSLSIAADPGAIFGNSGFYDGTDVEKKVSVEVLYPAAPGDSEQAEAGIESHSHNRLKRSLRLNFRAEYGDAKFRSQLFRKFPLGGNSAARDFDRLILRAGNNRSWARIFSKEKTTYALDEFARQSQIALSGHGMHGAFVHLYINGIYWGLYNPVERADQWFTSEYFGGEPADWFAVNHGGDLNGDDGRYDYLLGTLKSKDMSIPASYAELRDHLDVDNFVDYLVVMWYTATGDWPQNNWYGGNRNSTSPGGASPHRYFLWDAEWSWDQPHGSAPNPPPYNPWVHPDFRAGDSKNGPSNKAIANVFNSAKASPAFMQQFADRVYAHFANGGAMSDAACLDRWSTITDHIKQAVIGESARWGDSLEGIGQPTFTRDDHWQTEVDAITNLIAGRGALFIAALRAEGYYPPIDPPYFSQHGGTIAPGFQLAMNNPNPAGQIYYTLDGSDPTDAAAQVYSDMITLHAPTEVKARARDGATWSALHAATFVLPDPPALRITEIMYHPLAPDADEMAAGFDDQEQFEFVELQNVGGTAIELGGVAFTDGIEFTFGAGVLVPGGFLLLVSDPAAFAQRYGNGFPVAGSYTGNLRNSGENLRLATAHDQTIHDFEYKDEWYPATDGDGYSLNIRNPNDELSRWAENDAWFGGAVALGTPASAEPLTFAAWRIEHFGSGIPPGSRALDDPEGDGIPNLIEYALDLDPLAADPGGLAQAYRDDGDWVIEYRFDASKSDATPSVSTSTDLAVWQTVPDQLVGTAGNIQTRQARITLGGSAMFARLNVTQVTP